MKVSVALIVVGLAVAGISTVSGEQSPDEALREAREFRLKAMKGHCGIIGKKVAECYSGNKKTCDSLQDSMAWFTNEYSQTPELACTVEDPLGFGADQE